MTNRTETLLAALLVLVIGMGVGCSLRQHSSDGDANTGTDVQGDQEPVTDRPADGSVGGSGGASSTGGVGGTAGAGGAGAGGAPVGCVPACTGSKVCDTSASSCVDCLGTDKRCGAGDTPETCTNGSWVPGTACSISAVCSNGVCAALRVTGGLVSLASSHVPPSGTPPSYTLSRQSLELMPRTCNTPVTFCVTGGIQP